MNDQQRLLAKKQEIEDLIRIKQAYLMMPMSEYSDELSMYDQHPADVASDVYEREKEQSFLELLEYELEKVNDALGRFESGTYSICKLCGKPIEPARLQALSSTTLCAACAHKTENRRGSIDNEILHVPGAMKDMGEAIQVAGYEFYEQ